MSEPARRILVRPEAGGFNIDVVIEPPLPGGESLDRDFSTHADALSYSGGIERARGYPIVDQAAGANTFEDAP